MNSNILQLIHQLFLTYPYKAILTSKSLLSDYDQNAGYFYEKSENCEQNCRKLNCDNTSILCETCGYGKYVPFCLDCFLKSNHEDHNLQYKKTSIWKCCCGDLTKSDQSGFCANHSHDNNNQNEINMDTEKSDLISDVIDSALKAIMVHSKDKTEYVVMIVDFLLSITEISSHHCHLFAVIFSEQFDMGALLLQWPKLSIKSALCLIELFKVLSSDMLFLSTFSTFFFDNYMYLISYDLCSLEELSVSSLPTSVSILLSIENLAWDYSDAHTEMITAFSFIDIASKEIMLISCLVQDEDHPILSHSLIRDFFSNISYFFTSPAFLEYLVQIEYSEELFIMLDYLSNMDNIPLVAVNSDCDLVFSEYRFKGALLFQKNLWKSISNLMELECDSYIFFKSLTKYVQKYIMKDRIDFCEKDKNIFERSVFDKGVVINCAYPFHSLSFSHLCRHSTNGLNDWKIISENEKIDPNILIRISSLLSVRSLAFSSLSSFNLIPIEDSQRFKYFVNNACFNYDIIGLYSALVCLLSFDSETNIVISILVHIFDLNEEISSKKLFSFYNLIFLSIFDQTIFAKSDEELFKFVLIHFLKNKELTGSEIIKMCDNYITKMEKDDVSPFKNENSIFKYLHVSTDEKNNYNICNRQLISLILDIVGFKVISGDGIIRYKLKTEYNLLMPTIFYSASESFKKWTEIIKKYPENAFDKIIFNEDTYPNGFKPYLCLFNSYFYSFSYITLLNHKSIEKETICVLLSLLNVIKKYLRIESFENIEHKKEIIHADSLQELSTLVSNNFQDFMFTKINYKDNKTISLYELLLELGDIGNFFLNLKKNPLTVPSKQIFIKKYQKLQNNYIFSFMKHIKLDQKYYQIIIFNGLFGKQFQFTGKFKSDDNFKNKTGNKIYLPILQNGDSNEYYLSEKFINSFDVFQPITLFFISLTNIIKSLELRSRFNPFSVNDEKNHLLLFNSFKCFWLYYKNNKEEIKTESKFQLLMYLSLEDSNPYENFNLILHNVWKMTNDNKENYHLFLRYSFIFKTHCLTSSLQNKIPESFYDFKIQGYNELCKLFNLETKGFLFTNKIPDFNFPKLPHIFMYLYKGHQQILKEQNEIYVYILLSGEFKNIKDIGDDYSIFLVLNGKDIGFLYLSYQNKKKRIPSVYLSLFSEEGFESGEMIYLSEDRLIKTIDSFLSGEQLLLYC